jgi:hypothetical protein
VPKRVPGSNSSTGSQAPVRSKTSDHTPPHSILPTDSVFIDRCGAVRHAELIPSSYNSCSGLTMIQAEPMLGSCIANSAAGRKKCRMIDVKHGRQFFTHSPGQEPVEGGPGAGVVRDP